MPAAAGRLDADAVAGLQLARALRVYLRGAAAADERVAAPPSVLAARESVGRARAAVGEQGHARGDERLYLADDAVAALVTPTPARAAPQTVCAHAQRVRVLQSLGRGVQAVGHVRVDARDAVHGRARAHAARDRLVVSELAPRPRVNAPDGQVVHRTLTSRGHTFRERFR